MLTLLFGVVALTASLMFVASADAAGGTIAGKAMSSSSKAAISGIEVCAAENLFEVELFGHCAKTSASGEYSISDLPAGSYGVGFFAPEGSGLNYIPQYYNGKSLIGEAELVTVEASQTVSGINAAMQVGGQITGTVTSASTKAAIAGIQVCSSVELGQQCAETNASGAYTLSGLVTGSYTVYFSGPEGSGLNYIPQYYNGKSSYAEAEHLAVMAGNTKSGVNATMSVGGEVSGKVTDSSSKTALGEIEVCLLTASGAYDGRCATTSASGEYTIVGLVTGEYKVEFYPDNDANYMVQYYDGKSSVAEGAAVPVTAGSTTSGISAAMVAGGEIAGRVTSSSSKAALGGIEVCLFATNGEYDDQCATTNVNGEYEIVGLTTGEYEVEFYPNDGANYLTQYYSGKSLFAEAKAVSVTAGATTEKINAEMLPGGEITGKVTDLAGSTAVSNIQVSVYEASGSYPIAYATTNSSGEYAVSGLGTGEYKVEFSVPYGGGLNYLPQYYKDQSSLAAAESIKVIVEKTTAEINAKLQAGGGISGKVTNASSKAAMSGVGVCPLTTSGDSAGQCATTNSSGEYTIVALVTGEYKVSFDLYGVNYVEQYYDGGASVSEAEPVSVAAGSTESEINAAMVVGGQITGKAISATTKGDLEGVNVCATPRSSGIGECADTNSAGEYTIIGLGTGEYSVEFSQGEECGLSGCAVSNYLVQYYNGRFSYSEAEPVSVTAGSVSSGIDAAMVEAGKITGQVTNSATMTALSEIEVCPLTTSGGYAGQCTSTSPAGEYTITGLSPGEYKIEFYSNKGTDFTQYYNGKTSASEASAIVVTPASTTSGIDAAMVEGGHIAGKVTSAATKAGVESVDVCADDEGQGFFGGCSETNSAGEYNIAGLSTGKYSVIFEPESGNYLSQYYNGKASASEATLVSVAEATTTSGINATLAAGGQVKGTVTSAATKAAIAGVEVCAETQAGEFLERCASSGPTGEYAIVGLPTGKYMVRFSVLNGGGINYLPQYYSGKSLSEEATPVEVTAGSSTSSIDAAMAAGGQVTGVVTDASSKAVVEGVEVCALSTVEGQGGGCASTSATGEYALVGLATGEYKVEFSAPYGGHLEYVEQYYDGKSMFSEAIQVSVIAGSTKSGIDAAMVAKGEITGKLTNASTKLALGGIQVCPLTTSGSSDGSCTISSPNGEYTIVGLTAGEYRVEFSVPYGGDLNYLPQYYNEKESVSGSGVVSVSNGTVTSEINAAMAAGGEITGKVTNASTKNALGGIQVCPQVISGGSSSGQCVTSGAGGEYKIIGLSTGEYKVEFFAEEGGNYVTQYYNGKSSETEASPVSVAAGSTTLGISAAMVVGGKITGTVTNAATKAVLAGIRVCAQATTGGSTGSCATANFSGEYELLGLATGEYKVEFSLPYGSALNYLSQYYAGKESSTEASPVSATAGATTSDINAAMVAGGEITGKVTDAATRAALDDAYVCLEPPKSSSFGTCAYTNVDGEYMFAGLTAGEYKVEFESFIDGYSTQYYDNRGTASEAEPVSVGEGTTKAGIDAALVVGGQIGGTVTSAATKAGVSGIQACANSTGPEPFTRCADTGPGGGYTIDGLAGGKYTVEFSVPYGSTLNYLTQYYQGKESASEATVVSAISEGTTSGINAELAVAGEITGKVTNASAKVALGGIDACPEATNGGLFAQCVTTNSSGEYTIAGLATGEYKVEFYPNGGANYVPQYYDGKSLFSGASPVSVTAGSTTPGIDVAMVVGGQITGKLTNASTKAALGGVDVCARATSDEVFLFNPCATTSSSGEYTIVGLPTGEYRVEFDPYGQNYLTQFYNGKSLESEGSLVSVTAGSTTPGIDAELIGGGEITGKVAEASTKAAMAGIEVCSSPSEDSGFFDRCTTTNSGGEYTIVALTTGEYDVRFLSQSKSYAIQYYNAKTSLAFANAVPVTTGATTSAINAELANLPVSTGAPLIRGAVQQAQTLTEIHGSWEHNPTEYTYQWELCNSSGGECTDISEATKQTYVLVLADVGHTLRVSETAANLAGSSSPTTSAPTTVVLPLPPVNTRVPSISGAAQLGKTLTEVHGEWENDPTEYTYQWERCDKTGESCAFISGATEQAYKLSSADVGHTFRVIETAINDGGESIPAVSLPSPVILPEAPVNVSPPSISGSAVQGKVLSESHGTWTNEPTAYAYQWERCTGTGSECTAIAEATDSTYQLTSADVGHKLVLSETASNAGGAGKPTVSGPTVVVLSAVPVNTAAPAISGQVRQGAKLSETHGSWTNEPTGYTYQWERCSSAGTECKPILGATEQSYVLEAVDVGHELVVEEIAANAAGPGKGSTSAPSAVVVTAAPVNAVPPTISGTARQGERLKEAHGSWTNEPTSYEVQWLRCDASGENCVTITGGSEDDEYVLTGEDLGHTIRVAETASNAGGPGIPATSVPTAEVVAAAPVGIVAPTVSGHTVQNETLTEAHGTWTNEPSSYSYRWERCSAGGVECKAIGGATEQTYVLGAGDVGHELVVVEIASNAGGVSKPQASAPTAVIGPPVPVNTAPPTVSGTVRAGLLLTEEHGAWTNSPSSYTYQWERCTGLGLVCLPIESATHQTYVPTAADIGFTLVVQETASNVAGPGSPAVSVPTSPVAPEPPVSTAPPKISGTPETGQTLLAAHGTWTNQPNEYREQWLRCDSGGASCVAIHGAVSPAWIPVAADIGHALRVREIADNAGGPGESADSQPTTVVAGAPLQAVAGEELHATVGTVVTFDGSGSMPASEITAGRWDFGDGSSGEGETVTHAYSEAGTYTATLTVERGSEVSKESVTVTVTPSPPHEATVTVVDGENHPLEGAEVLYIGPNAVRTEATTNSSGEAKLAGLPDGTDAVDVLKEGYKPVVGQVSVSEGGGEATITLTGGALGEAHLKAHEMTLKEVEEAGINVNEPANNKVYEFEIELQFGHVTCHLNGNGEFVGLEACIGGSGDGGGGGSFTWTSSGGYGDGVGVSGEIVEGHPIIETLVLQGKVTVLKQFFAVSMTVSNLSPEPFKFTQGQTTLTVPSGMSLAPTPTPQSQTQSVPDIPGEGSAETKWILRGDTPGEYYLSASYDGRLEPFEAPFELRAATNEPLKVWGAEALGFHVQADSGFLQEGVPYHVKIGIVNKANIPLYNVAVETNGLFHSGFIYQPGQQFTNTVAELKPGETVYAPQDILVPDANSAGAFEPEKSSAHFVGEEVHPGEGIEAVTPPPLYTVSAKLESATLVHLHWQPSPGAEGYEVFSTPDLDTPFAAGPDAVQSSPTDKATVTRLPASATDAYIARGATDPPRFYAVTTLIGGQPRLEHPVLEPSIQGPVGGPLTLRELLSGGDNPSEFCLQCAMNRIMHADPVDAPTGNFWHSFTDLNIPGRGMALNLTRTYNSGAASTNGPFGYGWSSPYGMSLSFPSSTEVVVNQENGSQVTFTEQEGGTYTAPPRVTATLVHNGDGTWSFVRHRRDTFTFDSGGQLTQEQDLNGDVTSLAYDGSGQLETVTDPAGRKLRFAYAGSHIASVTDPLGRVVHYAYDAAGDLTDVTDVGGGDAHFTYDSAHRMLATRMPDQSPGVPGSADATVSNTYDNEGRVIEQTDQLGRTTKFSYSGEPLGEAGGTTTITDPKGNVTVQAYRFGELISETKGYGTPDAATWKFEYDQNTLGLASVTDPDGHTTKSTYDAEGNTLTTEDALGRKTVNTYDSLNDLLTSVDPMGVITTMTYDSHGNLLNSSRPLTGTSEVQRTSYTYGDSSHSGDVTAMTDLAGHTWKYTYDADGYRAAVTDPLGNETTYTYNTIGWLLSTTSPRGNIAAANPATFTTTYAHNSFGQVTETLDPLGHKTTSEYDPDQNLIASADADGHVARYAYDAADQQIAVHRADGTTLQTTYWPDGTFKEQIDGAGHATRYEYDSLGRVVAVMDPLGRVTRYGYDPAGNETSMTDPEGQVTTKTYDVGNELTSVSYSDGKTPDVTGIAYNADGERTAMTDGTGTSTFTYDSLDRMTSATDGSGAIVDYGYDMVGHLVKLTYPNGKTVARGYDAAGNLTSVTDWLGHTTTFGYDPDSNLSAEQYPGSVVTQLGYDDADRLTDMSDTDGAHTLAIFNYTRDPMGQLSGETADNGESHTTNYTYDALNQLTDENATPYGYDPADNPTTFGAGTAQSFDAANELTSRTEPGEVSEHPGGGATEEKESSSAPEGSSGLETPSTSGTGSSSPGTTTTGSPMGGVESYHVSYMPPPKSSAVSATSKSGGKLVSPKLRVHESHELLVAFISASGPTSGAQRVMRLSGDGLHWSLVARNALAGGDAEIWQAHAGHPVSGPVTVRFYASGYPATMTIAAFGASAYVEGRTTSHGHASMPAIKLNGVGGALIVAAGHSSGQKAAIAPLADQQLLAKFFDSSTHSAGWVQQTQASSTSARIADANPAAQWGMVAVAIASHTAQAARISRFGTPPLTVTPAFHVPALATSNTAPSANSVKSAAPDTDGSPSMTHQYTYNARGDRTGESSDGTMLTLSYDQANRLIGVGNDISYAYNGDGLRIAKTVNGTATDFVWSEAESLPELLQDGSTYYVYGPEGAPIEQISGTTPTYLHQDQQGSTRLLTDGEGNVVGRYNYDAWGGVTSHTGSATTNLQYDGQYTDAETGYQYLRARYYDPKTGQLLSRDPVEPATLSAYGFSSNSPLNVEDPSGLWAITGCAFFGCLGYDSHNGWGTGASTGKFGFEINPTDDPNWGVGSPGIGGGVIVYQNGVSSASAGGCFVVCVTPTLSTNPSHPAALPSCVQTCATDQQEYQMIVLKALNQKAAGLQQNLASETSGSQTYCATQTTLDQVNSQRLALSQQLQTEEYEP